MWRNLIIWVSGIICAIASSSANAQVLTKALEIKLVPNVGNAWVTVSLDNTYTDAIIVCTYNLPSKASPSATTRINNITATSFDLRVQPFVSTDVVTQSDVHCIISQEGAYDSGGLKYEARKVKSDGTSGLSVGWGVTTTEDVTADVTQTYKAPVTLGQVMSFQDTDPSVFWNFDCETRGNRAFFSGMADGICVGKHIGQINDKRETEILGYFVVETSTGSVNGIDFRAEVGPDTGGGVGNSPPYSYTVTSDYEIGVLTQAGEDGGHGGWAILYGADPLPNNRVDWAIEEETLAGDKTRTHTTENVGYWIFDIKQVPVLSAKKEVALFSGNATPYAIPGGDVIYAFKVENTGKGAVDADTIEIIDELPDDVTFYNGDIDDGGPLMGVVNFIPNGSGLTFTEATDLKFSNLATRPANFAACGYTPSPGYDANVTYICFNPKGVFNEGDITPSDFELHFRSRID
jgi:hypothetical protein